MSLVNQWYLLTQDEQVPPVLGITKRAAMKVLREENNALAAQPWSDIRKRRSQSEPLCRTQPPHMDVEAASGSAAKRKAVEPPLDPQDDRKRLRPQASEPLVPDTLICDMCCRIYLKLDGNGWPPPGCAAPEGC